MKDDLRRALVRIAKEDPVALASAVIIITLVTISVLAPFLAPFDPYAVDLSSRLKGPGGDHPLGTDELGRDILSRVLFGGVYTLGIALLAVALASLIGTITGLISGYYGGAVDIILMRVVDVMLAFPGILLALVIAGLMGSSPTNLAFALALTGWPAYTRLARASSLTLKEQGYIKTAKIIRAPARHILLRHILPNARGPLLALVSVDLAQVIIYAAAISFLGLGVQSPTPEWGAMLRSGVPYMTTAPHLTVIPGIMIVIAVLAFNFLGESVRENLDPREDRLLEVSA